MAKVQIHVDFFISSQMHLRVTLLQTIIKLEATYNVHVLLKLIWTNLLLDTIWTAIEWMMFCKHRASSCYTHFSGRMVNVWSRSGRRPHLHHKTKHALKKYVTITVNHNALQTEFKKKKQVENRTSWFLCQASPFPIDKGSVQASNGPSLQTVTAACPMAKLEFKIFWGAPPKVNIIHLPLQPVEGCITI